MENKPSIFVMVDMEGISGITQSAQVLSAEPAYQLGRKYMAWDTNACIDGCFRGGAARVVVRDAHGSGFNMLWDDIDGRAELIQGRAGKQRMQEIETFDALILLGYHARHGTPEAILEHTMSSKSWQKFWLNGVEAGELAIDGGIAGDHGVPVIMVSGDDKVCAEASELFKGLTTVAVKAGLNCQGGQLLSKETAHQRIRDGAEKAVKNIRNCAPYRVSAPVTMRLELVSRGAVPAHSPLVKVIDGRTYEVTADTVEKALNLL